MTRPKRYEGERLRAEQWHNMGRDKARERERVGFNELLQIVRGKFVVYCSTEYDPVECGYLVVTQVSLLSFFSGLLNPIFTHKEPALEFPSDHLKTKLLMIAG